MALSGELVEDVRSSLRRVLMGYTCGCALGVSVGLLTGRFWLADATLGSCVQLVRPLPVVALVPFTIILLGLGEIPKYLLVCWATFFPVWINTHLGVKGVDRRLIWAASSLGASRGRILLTVILPAAFGHVAAGMRTALASAFLCLVAVEMAGAFAGLGYRIEASHLIYRLDKMVAALVTLGCLGACSDALFAAFVSWAAPWHVQKEA
jgi:ABC-type nitrate/sulfonate/bicarbonate transport system permease component